MVLLNPISDRHGHLKNALGYGRDELTTDIIINGLSNRVLELKTKYISGQNVEYLLVKGKSVGISNFNSKSLNDLEGK